MPQQISLFDLAHDGQNSVGGGSLQGIRHIQCIHTYKDIISLENLLEAWKEFRNGKRKRKDVLEFERNLMRNIISLHEDLVTKSYRHASYEAFKISDPKPRDIHKATVRDRLLHHAIYRKLYPFFDKTFIADSYSCRMGNLTSQLLVNIYMNQFDQFMKHRLRAKYYIRYADDFVILLPDKASLKALISQISNFLDENLRLSLHPDKVFIKTFASGVDFLGWVHFSDHRILRTVAKKRMMRNIEKNKGKSESVQSYLGLLKHGNSYGLSRQTRQYLNMP